ncbi:hypothetical protein Pfo_008276 [Paulownia fortunei]|nr:hypothetical protein Pfo_008276 [Paulownia fortunei]
MGVKASKLSRVVSFRSLKRLRGPSLMTPRGYIPVAVGVDKETKRFMVHTTALSNAEFVQFLCRSAEEYGFCSEGIIRIPYDAKAFEEWMSRSAKQKIFRIQPTTT